jgi:hypothetical protein
MSVFESYFTELASGTHHHQILSFNLLQLFTVHGNKIVRKKVLAQFSPCIQFRHSLSILTVPTHTVYCGRFLKALGLA